MALYSVEFLSALAAIVVIDLVLAGDNAIVIALAARSLPRHLQKRAIVWGTGGAIVVRSAMTMVVVWLLKIPGLMLVGGAWSFLMMPLVNAQSRAQERAADRYALSATRNVDAFVTAMKRLSQQNLAEERPSPLVEWLFYSHPPIHERIEAAKAFSREDHHAA